MMSDNNKAINYFNNKLVLSKILKTNMILKLRAIVEIKNSYQLTVIL